VLLERLPEERQKGIEHRRAQLLGALEALDFDRAPDGVEVDLERLGNRADFQCSA
jgi:hypothetical protein